MANTWDLVRATPEGDAFLDGEMEIPMALGTVGGATRVHAGARRGAGV